MLLYELLVGQVSALFATAASSYHIVFTLSYQCNFIIPFNVPVLVNFMKHSPIVIQNELWLNYKSLRFINLIL